MIFANTKIREDVHLQLGYHKQLISKDYVELFCGFYIFIILTSHACQHNSRGKLCCRHRFGGQMIAQMNLFRGDFFSDDRYPDPGADIRIPGNIRMPTGIRISADIRIPADIRISADTRHRGEGGMRGQIPAPSSLSPS